MRFYGVVSDFLDETVELFPTPEEAEAVVRAWECDEPDQVGALRVEMVELDSGSRN